MRSAGIPGADLKGQLGILANGLVSNRGQRPAKEDNSGAHGKRVKRPFSGVNLCVKDGVRGPFRGSMKWRRHGHPRSKAARFPAPPASSGVISEAVDNCPICCRRPRRHAHSCIHFRHTLRCTCCAGSIESGDLPHASRYTAWRFMQRRRQKVPEAAAKPTASLERSSFDLQQ